jgi:hypothetical protein
MPDWDSAAHADYAIRRIGSNYMTYVALLLAMTVWAAPGPNGMTIRWTPKAANDALTAHVVRIAPSGSRRALADAHQLADPKRLGAFAEISTIDIALERGFAAVDTGAQSGVRYRYEVTLSDGESGTSNLAPPAGAKPRLQRMAITKIESVAEDRRIRLIVQPLQHGGFIRVFRSAGAAFTPVATLVCQGSGDTIYEDNVPAGRRYAYRAAWIDIFGNIGPQSSTTFGIAKDLHHPAAIGGVRAVARGNTVLLSWQRSSDGAVRTYDVFRGYANENSVRIATVSATATSFQDRVPEGSIVRYDVRARTAAGIEGYPGSGASLLVPKTSPPDSPSGLTARAVADGIDLEWMPSRDRTVTRYDVFRRVNRMPVLLAQVAASSRAFHVALPQGSLASYEYGVGAQDRFGNRVLPARWVTARVARKLPAAAAPLAASFNSGAVTVAVAPLTDPDVAAQRLYRRTDGAAAASIAPLSPKATAYRDVNVHPGHRYDYALAAVAKNGTIGARSAWVTARIPALAPHAPAVSAHLLRDRLTVELRWRRPTQRIAGYMIVRRAPNGTTVTVAPLVRAFVYRDVLLPNVHGAFSYALRIVTASGETTAAGPFTTVTVP